MAKRAAICIGVDHAGGMTPLQAAVKGARDFATWAKSQGCETKLLIDEANARVSVVDIFDAVKPIIDAGTYDQLIIYFSGHGILTAPGAEYWLLSRAPENPNEAVNLFRSVEDARRSGIPHVVFISDACRSSVKGPPLSGVVGGVIFPNQGTTPFGGSEIDVFYATRPGDPAYEVPEAEATQRYRGIFTDCLLKAVKKPDAGLVDPLTDGAAQVSVVTSRRLKPYLESTVPVDAATIDIKLRQIPELRVETALPKYFALVDSPAVGFGMAPGGPPPTAPRGTIDTALEALSEAPSAVTPSVSGSAAQALADELQLPQEVDRLISARGRGHFETQTGFSVFGANVSNVYIRGWHADPPFPEGTPGALHVRLHPRGGSASSIVFELDGTTGTALAVLPGFIGTVVVKEGRVIGVNYVPADNTWRFNEYQQREQELETLKALAAVSARDGRFVVEDASADRLAQRIRQAKGIDPTLGLYATYAYAQIGHYKDVYSVFTYMKDDEIEIPVPFDVVLLATRHEGGAVQEVDRRFAPFAPMLSQGWALLMPGDSLYHPIHQRLRPHLIPSLWTTFDAEGVAIARDAVLSGEVK